MKYGMKALELLIIIAAKWALDVSQAGNSIVGGLNTRRSKSNSTNAEE